jgi:cyclopropane fatty-acyl-phospholipid synthase-like methyltransferase
MQQTDRFAHKSKSWDMNSRRVKNAKSIAELILKNIFISNNMTLMDLGAGTGLLSYFIAPKVDKVVAVDNSPSMLEEFCAKSPEFECKTDAIYADIMKYDCQECYDLIISSMTIHHIQDIKALFFKLHKLLKVGGYIAIADLDSEDGTFHSEDTGVCHFGFNRDEICTLAKEAGFTDIKIETASIINKPHRDFSVFLLTAKK